MRDEWLMGKKRRRRARRSEWTVDTLKEHNEALRYADNQALMRALGNVATSAKVLAESMKEYKESQNEWRGTINDILAVSRGTKLGIKEFVGWIAFAVTLVVSVLGVFIIKLRP